MKTLTIFEGPDGSGKSTAAKKHAERTGARLVHCGPYLDKGSQLAWIYLEAMIPALMDIDDVVMDRCWISEPIYGAVFRGGEDRLGGRGRDILDHVAQLLEARVVLCLPPQEVCLSNWRRRHAQGGEYLEREDQLKKVWDAYARLDRTCLLTRLPVDLFDYSYMEFPK